MKHLAAMGIVGEKGADTYVVTPLAEALTEEKYRDGIIHTYVTLKLCMIRVCLGYEFFLW
jgi:hypothetical protein